MNKIIKIVIFIFIGTGSVQAQTASEILDKVDANMSSKNRVVESQMIIHGRRNDRSITSKNYAVGNTKSFTVYLSPAREQGTKMLKLNDKLWIYSPATDRVIQISGHLLRQSLMGSDLSYEDLMDDRKLNEAYDSKILDKESLEGRNCYVLELKAKFDDLAYDSQKIWIDQLRFVPLKQDLFAKSGKLIKSIRFSDVQKVQGRWFPFLMVYKDMLKQGKGTEFKVLSMKFNQQIEDYIFTKAALKQ